MDYLSNLEDDYLKKAAPLVIVALGLGVGFFAQGIFDEPADESNQINYITVSEDPNFESVDTFATSGILEDKRFYNWSVGSIDLGTWHLKGYGGRAPAEILYGVEEPKMILHPWTRTRNPDSSDWFSSNITQTVEVPESSDRIRAVIRGESAADALYSGVDGGKCPDTVMGLEVLNQENQSVFEETKVVSNESQITANVTDFKGQELHIYGTVNNGGECGTYRDWLQMNFLGLQAANTTS